MTASNKREDNGGVRQDVLLDYLRGRITSGSIPPGQQLPTHKEIQEKFGTSRVTVQRAFDQLVADGFIRTEPKVGRFVTDSPPHLSRYALVFQGEPSEERPWEWSRSHTAILEAARRIAAQKPISFVPYYNVSAHADSEGYQSLLRDTEAHRMAGMLFVFAPIEMLDTKLLTRPSPPRVTPANAFLGMPARALDADLFMPRALAALKADGRRRVALITPPNTGDKWLDTFPSLVAAHGMETLPYWTQAAEPYHTRWVRHALHAILHSDPNLVPDALIITDDHLVEAAAVALAELKVNVPGQMRVIGHWNFPLKYHGPVPVDLLGFDFDAILPWWVNTIDAQRRGEPVEQYRLMPPRFEWEVPPQDFPELSPEDPVQRARAANAIAPGLGVQQGAPR